MNQISNKPSQSMGGMPPREMHALPIVRAASNAGGAAKSTRPDVFSSHATRSAPSHSLSPFGPAKGEALPQPLLRFLEHSSKYAGAKGGPTSFNLDPNSPDFDSEMAGKFAPETFVIWQAIANVLVRYVTEWVMAAMENVQNTDAMPADDGPDLFGAGGPSYKDIYQGDLKDCYFLTALGAVAAENPSLIKDHIRPLGDGMYEVLLYGDNGKLEPIVVSDAGLSYADVVDSDGDHVYEKWVALYERAWAYQVGGGSIAAGYAYLAQHGGWGDEAYYAITGERSTRDLRTASTNGEYFPEDYLDRIFRTTRGPAEGGAMVLIGSVLPPPMPGTLTRDHNSELIPGLPAAHMYQVLDYNPDTKMVTLRNPWGHTEPPLGKYQGDGIFTMSLDDVQRYFDLVTYSDA